MIALLPTGLALGSAYALLALGYTLAFGVLRRVDLAYGATILAGLYAALWLRREAGIGSASVAPAMLAVTAVAGVLVDRLCFAHRAGRPATTAMATGFALWMVLQEGATLLLPGHSQPVPPLFGVADGLMMDDWLPAGMRSAHLVALAAAAIAAAALWGLLHRTRPGLAMRALIDNPAAAVCAGLPVTRLSLLAVVISGLMGGLAGGLIAGIDGQVGPMFAMTATLKGLAAAILGGLGSLPGALAGGLILGLAETVFHSQLGPQGRALSASLLLLGVLALRPAGLASLWGGGGAAEV